MTIFVDTKTCARVSAGDMQGEVAEIVNRELCGAEDVVAKLRWLKDGEKFEAEAIADTHQLIYLMEGDGVINLDDKDYDVRAGAGIYLGPGETASVAQAGGAALKLLHIVAPKIEGR